MDLPGFKLHALKGDSGRDLGHQCVWELADDI